MEPVEKEKIDYVEIVGGILIGVAIASWYRNDPREISVIPAMPVYGALTYLVCRFVRVIPSGGMLAVFFGGTITGFWQMQTNHVGGLGNVVISLGSAIGVMLARYVLAKKASHA